MTKNYDNIDNLITREPFADKQIIYTDSVKSTQRRGPWELQPIAWTHPVCERRTSRWHKLHPHVLFPGAEYTIWMDGSQQWKKGITVQRLFDDVGDKQNMQLATFKHSGRNCIYEEQKACIESNRDRPILMRRQIDKYRQEGYPANFGLIESAFLIRKNCKAVTAFNEAWWKEISEFSLRDQLSFNYVCWKQNFKYHILPGSRWFSKYFEFHPHG